MCFYIRQVGFGHNKSDKVMLSCLNVVLRCVKLHAVCDITSSSDCFHWSSFSKKSYNKLVFSSVKLHEVVLSHVTVGHVMLCKVTLC